MSKKVLVLAEVKDGKLRNVSFEALSAAKAIANGGEIASVLFGSNMEQYGPSLGHYGASKVYLLEDSKLDLYTTDLYKDALLQVINDFDADVILVGHTGIGRDLTPKVAQALQAGMISDSIAIELVEDQVVFTRPIYAGKAFVKKAIKEGKVIATIRPNNIPAGEPDSSLQAEMIKLTYQPSQEALLVKVRDVIRKASKGVDLTEAKVVVSGGRGVKSKDGFNKLYELADLLNAAVGSSRGACDAEYSDYSLQVGQTGKVVTPDLYFAFGISGAIQHVAGMSNSKVIVAVNKDPEAPIFQIADYGIVADMFDVLPILIEEIKKINA